MEEQRQDDVFEVALHAQKVLHKCYVTIVYFLKAKDIFCMGERGEEIVLNGSILPASVLLKSTSSGQISVR